MINPLVKGVLNGLRPDPRLLVSEWADRFRVLTTESSAEAGLWKTDRTPYLKEIMDVLSPSDPTQQVKVIKGTQLGFTEAGLCAILCYLDYYPCPILMIQPTETLAKGTSKRRITPAIRAIPSLYGKVKQGKAKEDAGEIFTKEVPGGSLQLGWSNSSASFRSFSARVVVLDDIDGYGLGFGEGDVINLGKARADAFSNRKIYINSTPTVEGKSLIEKEYIDSDQREYFMPCPHCNKLITFEWENFVFKSKKSGDEKRRITSDVTYKCPECNEIIQEHQKTSMMKSGVWIPQNPESEHKGYRLPSFYSPIGWLSWRAIALEFLNAKWHLDKGDATMMQVWQNTRNARAFKEQLEGIDAKELDGRLEPYNAQVPGGVMLITAGIDTQDDRYEVVVIGHGKQGEMWYIDHKIIGGDPSLPEVQYALDDYLDTQFETESGATMKIFASSIDSGGHHTQTIYDYVKARTHKRVFALKGSSILNAPIVSKTMNMDLRSSGFKPYVINTNALKDDLFARLKILIPGDRFVHFSDNGVFDAEFFLQLTAEQREETGRYVKIRKRNEILDCSIYAMVTLQILGVDINNMRTPYYHIGETRLESKIKKKVQNRNYLDEY